MEYLHEGSPETVIDGDRADELVGELLGRLGPRKRVLLIPPDFTRFHSTAGDLAASAYRRLASAADVWLLPALGTHSPMTPAQIARMFPGVPPERVLVHDWRGGLAPLGEVPGQFVREVSEGRVEYPIEIAIHRTLVEEDWDLILSIGQLVPHEVVGIANHSKNIFIGVGGAPTIHKSHFLGAVYGMERMMGRARTPVRAVLEYASRAFARGLPIVYLLTVRSRDRAGTLVTRGLFAGDDDACFYRGSELVRRVNLDLLDEPISKAVVFLDPEEYKSTWLGNKAIYRTRMAMADGGELVVLAPGVREFGEDAQIDRLIREHGYRGTEATLAAVQRNAALSANLSAAAHLIHGSSEGRFRILYCPGGLSREEILGVGFEYADPGAMRRRYDPERLRDGWNDLRGERIYFISNPGLGLWGTKRRFGAD